MTVASIFYSFSISNFECFTFHFLRKMDSRLIGTSGHEVERVRLDDPLILSSTEVSNAILGGENIWK